MTDGLPRVSIGIPTYNRPSSLRKSLECLVAQTYTNLEIIISDNCSPGEETQKLAADFVKRDKRIRYFRQEINKGAISNFQFVLDQASGDYFMWLADDDWIDSDYIEKCIKSFIDNEGFALVGGKSIIYDENKNVIFKEDNINFLSNNRYTRVAKYYSIVNFNCTFYSIIPMNYAKEIKCSSLMADDWLIVARMLFLGRSLMLNDTSFHRLQGVSKNLDSMKEFLHLPKLNFNNYYYIIAKNAASDILKNDFYKKRILLLKRIIFALIVFIYIIKRGLIFNFKRLWPVINARISYIKKKVIK